jgi:hypothetical protein
MAVKDELSRLFSARGKSQPVDNIIKSALKKLQKIMTSLAGHFVGDLINPVELPLVHSVETAKLLLLPETDPVFTDLGPWTPALHFRSGTGFTFSDRTFCGVATVALEEELGSLSLAQTARRPYISAHKILTLLD